MPCVVGDDCKRWRFSRGCRTRTLGQRASRDNRGQSAGNPRPERTSQEQPRPACAVSARYQEKRRIAAKLRCTNGCAESPAPSTSKPRIAGLLACSSFCASRLQRVEAAMAAPHWGLSWAGVPWRKLDNSGRRPECPWFEASFFRFALLVWCTPTCTLAIGRIGESEWWRGLRKVFGFRPRPPLPLLRRYQASSQSLEIKDLARKTGPAGRPHRRAAADRRPVARCLGRSPFVPGSPDAHRQTGPIVQGLVLTQAGDLRLGFETLRMGAAGASRGLLDHARSFGRTFLGPESCWEPAKDAVQTWRPLLRLRHLTTSSDSGGFWSSVS